MIMETVITSKQNSLVKYVRGLRLKRNRDLEGICVIEGPKMIAEALNSAVCPEKVLISERGGHLQVVNELTAVPDYSPTLVRVSDAVMEYITETETPQGILALVRLPDTSLESLRINSSSVVVVLEGVQDPGNVGTIIRTADAFGVEAVITCGECADVYNAKVLRSTMGSVFRVPVVRDAGIPELKRFFKQNDIFVALTSPQEKAVSLAAAGFRRPLAVAFGSEARGVSEALARLADVMLTIPMPGLAESLNVAVAAGIVLHEAFREPPF